MLATVHQVIAIMALGNYLQRSQIFRLCRSCAAVSLQLTSGSGQLYDMQSSGCGRH